MKIVVAVTLPAAAKVTTVAKIGPAQGVHRAPRERPVINPEA